MHGRRLMLSIAPTERRDDVASIDCSLGAATGKTRLSPPGQRLWVPCLLKKNRARQYLDETTPASVFSLLAGSPAQSRPFILMNVTRVISGNRVLFARLYIECGGPITSERSHHTIKRFILLIRFVIMSAMIHHFRFRFSHAAGRP